MFKDIKISEYLDDVPEDRYIRIARDIFNIVDILDESRSVVIKIDDDLNIIEVKVNY